MSGVGQDLTNIGPTYVNYKFTSYTGVIRKVPQRGTKSWVSSFFEKTFY